MSQDKAGYGQNPPAYSTNASYPAYPSQPQPQYGQPYGVGAQYAQTSSSTVVVNQPGQYGVAYTAARPPDYMAASVIACLCCFWPTGLCAIYFASQANSAVAAGDMETATRMSNNARNLMISSIVIGVIWITLVIVLRVVVYANYYNGY